MNSNAEAALREAATEFCRRVEAGEIRSKRSYAAFKAALSASGSPGDVGREDAKAILREVWGDLETCAIEADTDDWHSRELSEETFRRLSDYLFPEKRNALDIPSAGRRGSDDLVLGHHSDIGLQVASDPAAPQIDWSKPIETKTGIKAKLLWPEDTSQRFVEIECGRWLFNDDGSNFDSPYGDLRNVAAPQGQDATIKRCPQCGAGPVGNCGYYGCETPRETCPLRTRAPEATEAVQIALAEQAYHDSIAARAKIDPALSETGRAAILERADAAARAASNIASKIAAAAPPAAKPVSVETIAREWQPIESAPKDGTEFLWCNTESGRQCVIHWPDYDLCFEHGAWQPLPAALIYGGGDGR